jgi:peptide deformylase
MGPARGARFALTVSLAQFTGSRLQLQQNQRSGGLTFDHIFTYGESVLREKARPIAKVDDRVRQVAKDLLVRMYEADGLGLAAEQVGLTEAICVIDTSRAQPDSAEPIPPMSDPPVGMPLVLINPAIEESAGRDRSREGCLSFPEIYVEITRAAEVRVSYLDQDGRSMKVRASGLLARVIQHETDHLNGVLLVDHMSPVQKVALAGRLRRLKKEASA